MPLPAQPPPPPHQQPACAACKHQRRRCTPDCPLAGYFPHDHPGLFRAAHRLFGVSNILKTLRRAGPDQARRDDAMRAVIFEAGAWDANPAHGCLPFINELERQLHHEESVLSCLHAQLRHYRHRPDSTSPLPMPPPTADAPPAPAESSNTHQFDDEYNHVPAESSGLLGNGNGDAHLLPPWTTQLDYYDGAIADMGGAVSQLQDQYQLLFDRTATATAAGDEHEYDEISPFLADGDDHHDGTPPYESKSASSREKMEIKPSKTMELK